MKLNKNVGLFGAIYASIGGIIGSGWLFGPLHAVESSGIYSILAWFIGAAAMLTIAFCYAELSTMFPKSGALIHLSYLTHGELLGKIWSWILFLAYVCIAPIEVMAVLTYASNYIPDLVHAGSGLLTMNGFFVSIVMLAILVVVNFFAVRWVIAINSTITIWKIIIPIATVFVLLSYSFHPENLAASAHGFHLVDALPTVATAGIAFSYFGFRNAIDIAGETSNPAKQIPIALISSIAICLVIYIGLQLAFILSVPNGQTANWSNLSFSGVAGPLAAISIIAGAVWWSVVLYADALISPLGTGYIYTTTSSRVIMAAGETGSAPKSMMHLNRFGSPWKALVVTFIFGCIFFFPFPSWQKMVSYVSSITVLSYGIGPVILLQLRKSLPNKKRPFTLKGAYVIAPVAFFISNAIIIWSGYAAINFMFSLILILFILFLFWQYFIKRVQTEIFGWAHMWWTIPYFLGLWLISKYSPTMLGGSGGLSFGMAMLLTLILSGLILAFALRSSVDDEKMSQTAEYIDNLQG
ncbi:APC family permease [Fangia hongkongensis]|uniref:APC family permease n=1 Tax=Fangia hongkongensis TaxID=270495 RepID=UPI00036C0AC9|nr:APC family permease [Fangia hongkongensis]MBK2123866.1 APC family permease [Fangia hongkongensis]